MCSMLFKNRVAPKQFKSRIGGLHGGGHKVGPEGLPSFQKNPRARKFLFAHNSGAGNGCANFMGVSIKFLVLGGGVFWGWGGGAVPILFLWARGFF